MLREARHAPQAALGVFQLELASMLGAPRKRVNRQLAVWAIA